MLTAIIVEHQKQGVSDADQLEDFPVGISFPIFRNIGSLSAFALFGYFADEPVI